MKLLFASLPVACVLVLAGAASVLAAEIDVISAIDAVTVYPDGATVTRLINIDLPAGDSTLIAKDFPPGLDPSSLRVEGEGTGVTIGAIDARPPRAERPVIAPEIEKRIETLRDERQVLDDKIAAEAARKSFAQRFANNVPFGLGEKGEARPLTEWRAAFGAVAEETATADNAMREARLKQREIDRELARLDAQLKTNPPRKMEVRVDLAANGAGRSAFRVSYTVRGARWAPLYDARLDSGAKERKPALELIRRAEIVQQTGEDWSDVALSVSTVRTAKGGSAPELRPLIVRFPQPMPPPPRPMMGGRADQQPAPATAAAPEPAQDSEKQRAQFAPALEREAAVESSGYQVVYRVPGRISVAANDGAKSFRVASAKIAPDLLARATPALDETAFVEASFRQDDEAPLLPGRIALYRDGIYVGRGQMALTPKDEIVRLGFGADDKVKISRATLKQIEGSAGFVSSAKTDRREYKTTVRNHHEWPIKVILEDQIPVSEVEDIKVEMLPATPPPSERDARERRGVMAWNFDLAPGEAKEIKFGWRMRWPADKVIAYDPRLP
jgi:uncharacterized protein (TIGR02231 family)